MPRQNEQIAQLLTDDSFLRWINDEADPVEQRKWDRWMEEDPANIHLLREARDLYQSLRFEEVQPNTNTQHRRLREALEDEKKFRRRVHPAGKKNPKSYWMRAAAVMALLLALLAVIQYAGWSPGQPQVNEESTAILETAQTDYGETRILTFSDGSEIRLNAHSKLTYPATARPGEDIEVELQGEAYFSVERKSGGQQRTFFVNTREGRIAVLGTKFNVNTYAGNTEIILEEGEIQVGNRETAYLMSPNQLVRLQPGNGEIVIDEEVDTELYTSWTNFELRFQETSLQQVARRIEQIYGVKVVFKEEYLKNIELSGSAPNKNFAVLLEGLRTLLDIPIVHKENTIIFGN